MRCRKTSPKSTLSRSSHVVSVHAANWRWWHRDGHICHVRGCQLTPKMHGDVKTCMTSNNATLASTDKPRGDIFRCHDAPSTEHFAFTIHPTMGVVARHINGTLNGDQRCCWIARGSGAPSGMHSLPSLHPIGKQHARQRCAVSAPCSTCQVKRNLRRPHTLSVG